MFCCRLNTFIERYKILSNNQYGFRNNHSTSLALLDLVKELTNSIDDKKITVGNFSDLKKAFDTINHELLLKKLECYGIRGIAFSWLKNYIEKRKQFVSLNNVDSSLLDITCGVPQGSVLGPLLFILYINDLCNVSEFLRFVLFADDTNLFASGDNIDTLCNNMNKELHKINFWFKINKLSLNLSKTNFMVFSNKVVIDKDIDIKIDDVNITRVYECKFLGVLIDSKLSWKSHSSLVKDKLIKCNAIMYKASIYLNSEALRTLYCSLFLPYINNCCEVWGTTYKKIIESIIKLQKRAIQIVSKMGNREHTNALFCKLKLLTFLDLTDLKIAVIIYKARMKLLTLNVQKKFTDNIGNTHCLRSKNKFMVKHARTTPQVKLHQYIWGQTV